MTCFRDMTFCDSQSCLTLFCPRRLTPDVWVEANKWWGAPNPPVAFSDFTMTCPDYTDPDTLDNTLTWT